MKKTIIGAAAIAALSSAGLAQASSAGQWEMLEYQNGSSTYVDGTNSGYISGFTFSGPSSLSYSSIVNADCMLTLDGETKMDTSANRVYIRVTGGTVAPLPSPNNDPTCNDITVDGFNWQAYDPGTTTVGIDGSGSGDIEPPSSSDYAVGDISQITVKYKGNSICRGTMQGVQFSNGNPKTDPSSFTFNNSIPGVLFGSCSVDGTLKSQNNGDVNVW